MSDILFYARIQHMLETAVDGLSEEDRAERIEHCQRTGEHGVRMQPDADGITFMWGGRTLAVANMAVFDFDAYFEPIGSTFIPAAPDDLRDLTDPASSTPDETSMPPDDEDPATPAEVDALLRALDLDPTQAIPEQRQEAGDWIAAWRAGKNVPPPPGIGSPPS